MSHIAHYTLIIKAPPFPLPLNIYHIILRPINLFNDKRVYVPPFLPKYSEILFPILLQRTARHRTWLQHQILNPQQLSSLHSSLDI